MPDSSASVMYPVGRSPRLAKWLIAMWGMVVSAMVFSAFLVGFTPTHAWTAVVFGLSFVTATGSCWWFWRQQKAQTLAWDGERWGLQYSNEPMIEGLEVQVVLDMQRALLLRLENSLMKSIFWVWADAGHDAARWHLLRCALYFPARSIRQATLVGVGHRS